MRDRIINVLENSDIALTIYEIEDFLDIKEIEDIQLLQDELNFLSLEGIIYHSNKDRYMMLKDSHLKRGIMRANKKGFGFVDIDDNDEDVYISQENMNGAIHDDVVLVDIISKKNMPRLERKVIRILKRERKTFIGEINFKKDIGYITLDDVKVKLNIEICRENSMHAVDGHKVVVSLLEKLDKHGRYSGEVIEILGHKNDPGVDILSIVRKYNIEVDFPDDVKEQLKLIPSVKKIWKVEEI